MQLADGLAFSVACGNDKLMSRFKIDLDAHKDLRFNLEQLELSGKTVICLAVDGVPRLLISLEEEHLCKPEAKPVLDYLQKELGLKVAIITGDNRHSALKVANYLQIPEERVTARAYPAEKKRTVQRF